MGRARTPRLVRALAVALCVLAGREAHADVDFGRALRALGDAPAPRAMRAPKSERYSLLLRPGAGRSAPRGAVRVGGGWFTLAADAERARSLAAEGATLALRWSPPRRLLLDHADGWTRASTMRRRSNATGRGVVIGIVDTGVDVAHPDLRDADGSTRVRWLIDFTRPALGRHPELEREYGCLDAGSECAIYAGADIDELIGNTIVGDEPRDTFGHGTHVASLAAGNGRGSDPAQYVGVAPEADLVVARVVLGADAGILDGNILRAARFVFERAQEAGAPAVLNLSLGSDFGAHDGSSALERALSSFVGPDQPGRAIVVAAGNSAGLYESAVSHMPGPFGVHTSVHVPRRSPVVVPLLAGRTDRDVTNASIYVWITFRRGDDVAVGLLRNGEELVGDVRPGGAAAVRQDNLEATILNGVEDVDGGSRNGSPSAVILIEGRWPSNNEFGIRLEGLGTASLWVQSTGDLDPSVSLGAAFPYASKEGTINVPASAPDLIAVGATLNRIEWRDYLGEPVRRAEHGALAVAPPDTTAYFSSAGPNALGVLKPDIVAPGAHVIGAMAALADPRRSGTSGLFVADGRCEGARECFVVDDRHAVASGTSMAAPLVAGAIALFFERDPSLTQHGVRALLQAGARPLEGAVFSEQQASVGALDIDASLAAQIAESNPIERVPSSRSWLALAASHARPDPEWPLVAHLELRDADGAIADGFDPARLGVSVRGGSLAQAPMRLAPGLYRFSVVAPGGSGGTTLTIDVAFDGQRVLSREVPVAVDPGAATGAVSARGGCAVPAGGNARGVGAVLTALLALCLRRRRRPTTER